MKRNEVSLTLPALPGVYIFKNEQNEIIYVGKAKELKKRVGSYFALKNKDWKVTALLDEHKTIEHIVTQNETEALLLEAQLIRDNKPKFNVLLKSGQPFVYLLISSKNIPQLKLVRNQKEKGKYFGPFLQKSDARHVYYYLIRTFKLALCNKKISHGCLDYHLEKCAGMCRDDFDQAAYLIRLELASKALEGKYEQLYKSLHEQLDIYKNTLEFEKAQHLYSVIKNFHPLINTLKTKFTEKKYDPEIIQAMSKEKPKQYASAETTLQLKELFALQKTPRTIDCFDISHFQSRYIVGSCVRFIDGIPDKNNFRRFKIRSLSQQNDYAALQEIVSRRYRNDQNLPDLVVIDGGKGQLNAVKHIITQTDCIALAKREETIFSDKISEGVKLDLHTNVGKLLIALRDYTHHFAVRYHQILRNKGVRAP